MIPLLSDYIADLKYFIAMQSWQTVDILVFLIQVDFKCVLFLYFPENSSLRVLQKWLLKKKLALKRLCDNLASSQTN